MAKPSGYVTLATDLPSWAANAVALIFQQQGKSSVRAGLKELLEWQIKLHETPYLAKHYAEMMHLAIEGDAKGLSRHLRLMSPDEKEKPCVQYLKSWTCTNDFRGTQIDNMHQWMTSEGRDIYWKSLQADRLEQENRELRRLLARYEEPRA